MGLIRGSRPVQIDAQHTAYGRLPEGARIPPLWLQPLVYLLVAGLVLAGMLVMAIGASVLFTIVGREPPPDIMSSWISELLLSAALSTLAVAIVVVWIRKVERRPLSSAGMARGLRLADVSLFGLGGLWAFVLIAALIFTRPEQPAPQVHAFSTAVLEQAPIILAMVVMFAVAEEVVFRGWILSDLTGRAGPVAGLAVSSVLFASAHVVPWEIGQPAELLSFLSYVAMGAVLGATALMVGEVWSSTALHAGFNAVITFLSLATSESDTRAVWLNLASGKRGLGDVSEALVLLAVHGILAAVLVVMWRRRRARSPASA
jgi:membrane protease YdiL (CAAX protease family)